VPQTTESSDRGLTAQQNDSSFENIWQELRWRGLVHVSTDEAELEKLLTGDPVTYYCGFDPTAPSLHLGNLVQLLLMRRLQLRRTQPLALVGGSTGWWGTPGPPPSAP
jgi:tyrosyl-tRNA synthetase